MLTYFPRLPVSFDPLIAEAKRRARQRRALVAFGVVMLVGLAVGLTLAFRSPGGGPPGGAPSGKLTASARPGGGSGWPGVTKGMTAKAVLATAGRPLRVVRSNPRNPDCWAYPRGDINDKRGWWSTYGEHVAVCFEHGRVDYVGP